MKLGIRDNLGRVEDSVDSFPFLSVLRVRTKMRRRKSRTLARKTHDVVLQGGKELIMIGEMMSLIGVNIIAIPCISL